IQGRSAVAVVESFARPEGAAWLAQRARELTGRWPDIAILTHYHGDHTAGIEGYAGDNVETRIHVTEPTRERILSGDARRETPPPAMRATLLGGASILPVTGRHEIDLGGRTVRVIPHDGHTASDVTVELDEPAVVWCGDLVWNRMVPNYVDAIPSHLSRSVRALRRTGALYVPGHGPLADDAALDLYLALIDDIEAAGRRAFESGTPAAAAAAAYTPPAAVAQWTLFSPRYFEVAIGAWLRELGGNGANDSGGGTDGTQPFDPFVVS
ncbi:MAG: MBL fold metallo-hydrolase, partial [Longimicrobiales bacterium]